MIYYGLIASLIVHVLAGVLFYGNAREEDKVLAPIEVADIAPTASAPKVPTPPKPAAPRIPSAPRPPKVVATGPAETIAKTEAKESTPATVAVPSAAAGDVEGPVAVDYRTALWAAIESKKEYPALARSRRQMGKVKVAFKLEKDGLITDVHVSERCEYEILNQAAIDTLTRLGRFRPIPDQVSMQAMLLVVPLNFRMSN